ncbi:5-formyltetrahydrofolate cyclo-ligase [Rheinheimera maricola]|uniref:5-formyltetrahydrofolate cyclo-ligase n=1 Tax=Rheinheimera maricola TaxID=2793282 RepID=A0ABS7X9R3_9GAMM|nr:5-formyltetrahydrofolate cyclo-ligase [Rheinheimera maricola]MBZ9611885.1 5-formyltetrahydrofolate cyclo-ligase [Rheinheimera maricola]
MTTTTHFISVPDNTIKRQQLRQQVRQRRQQLSPATQQQAALDLVTQTMALADVQRSQHIALYLANDGELDTYPLIQTLWQQGKSVYLPVLHLFVAGYLLFVRYDKNTLLYPNKFGIPEPLPACHLLMPLQQLDIIFTPLVAFDAAGNRLGMGGGFYDRTLSQLPPDSPCRVIGLAHSCQQVDAVPGEAWDIPLKQIITPTKHWVFA